MNPTVTTAASVAALLFVFALASLAAPHEGPRFSLRAPRRQAPRVERCAPSDKPDPPPARGDVLLSQAR